MFNQKNCTMGFIFGAIAGVAAKWAYDKYFKPSSRR